MNHRTSLLTGALLALLTLTPALAQPGMGGPGGGGRGRMMNQGIQAGPGGCQRPKMGGQNGSPMGQSNGFQRPGGFGQNGDRFGQMGFPDRTGRGDGPQGQGLGYGAGGRFRGDGQQGEGQGYGPRGRFRGDGQQGEAVVADPDSPNRRPNGDSRQGNPGYVGPCDANPSFQPSSGYPGQNP